MAFGAGLVSFLSPCVLPLVPGYISAVAGGTPDQIRVRRVIGPSLMFVATFSAIFIALGLLGQQALRGALTGPAALKVCGGSHHRDGRAVRARPIRSALLARMARRTR